MDRILTKRTVIKQTLLLLLSFITAWITYVYNGYQDGLVLFLTVFYMVFFNVAAFLLGCIDRSLERAPHCEGRSGMSDRKRFFLTAAILFLCYIPYLFIFFPGTCNWDTINQIFDYYNGTDPMPFSWIRGQEEISVFLNDHHPVFDTLIFSFFIWIGRSLGDINTGMALFILVQLVAVSLVMSMMLMFMRKKGCPKIINAAALVFTALMPFIAIFNVTMIKDTTFTLCFVLYLIVYISLNTDRPGLRDIIALIVLSVLLSLTKKTGIYIILLSNLGLFFNRDLRKRWKGIILSVLIPGIIMKVILAQLIFPAANIWPGGKQEILSTFIQHVSCTVVEHPEDIDENEAAVIDRVVDYNAIPQKFNPHSTDGVKDTYRFYAESSDIKDFMILWLKTGLTHPVTYLKASAGTCGGFFAPVSKVGVYTGIPDQKMVEVSQPEDTLEIRQAYNEFLDHLSGLLIFKTVVYSFWIPLYVLVMAITKKKSKVVISMIPVLVSILTLIASPYSGARYALPLIYTAFLIYGMLYFREEKEDRDQASEGT